MDSFMIRMGERFYALGYELVKPFIAIGLLHQHGSKRLIIGQNIATNHWLAISSNIKPPTVNQNL